MKTGKQSVSVIIPTFNCAEYLPETIESVLAQTRPVHEIIVVDDGSTDDTDDVMKRFAKRVTYLWQPNRGQASARNRGLDLATGDWVAFLDADDVWLPAKIERQLASVSGGGRYTCIHTAFTLFGDHFGDASVSPGAVGSPYDTESLLSQFVVLPSTALVKGGLWVRFPEWARTSEDAIYFAELAALGRFAYLDEPLVKYRKHRASVTARHNAGEESLSERLRWIEERPDLALADKERLRRLVAATGQDYLAPIIGGLNAKTHLS